MCVIMCVYMRPCVCDYVYDYKHMCATVHMWGSVGKLSLLEAGAFPCAPPHAQVSWSGKPTGTALSSLPTSLPEIRDSTHSLLHGARKTNSVPQGFVVHTSPMDLSPWLWMNSVERPRSEEMLRRYSIHLYCSAAMT